MLEQLLGKRRAVLVLGCVGALALLAALGWVTVSRYAEHANRRTEAQTESQQAQAAALAGAVSATLAAKANALADIASEPAVIDAVASGDAARMAAVAAEHTPRVPGLLRLRLLPRDVSDVDSTTTPPLTFASLEMLREAAAGDAPVNAEVLLLGSPAQHLAMVERVHGSDGTLIGFVHGSFDVAVLQEQARSWQLSGAYAQLVQSVSKGAPLVIAKAGGAAPPEQSPVVKVRVPGSRLEVSYWATPGAAAPSETTVPAPGSLPPYLPAAAAAALVLLIAAAWWMRRRKGPAEPELSTVHYEGAVKAIMEGAHPGLERLVPGLPVRGIGGSSVQPLSQGLEGEDITVVTRKAAAAPPPAPAPGMEVSETDMIDFGLLEEAAGADETPVVEERVPAALFRAYDIRGVVNETLSDEIAYAIGRALGAEAHARDQQSVVVARDGRMSSPMLADALIQGLLDAGSEVIDIGLAPTPVLYFATHYLDTRTGVMVTGSHNPQEWNGFKIVLDGDSLSGEAIAAIRDRINRGDYVSGKGSLQQAEITTEYIRRISEEIPVALGNPFKVVVDAGNSVAGTVAPQLLRALGHDVIELYCELDGSFPNHHPDPSQPENLIALVSKVIEEEADLGLAFDGDGDRLGVVDGEGNTIWPDRQLMLFASDVLTRNPGAPIVFDVKCTRRLADVIQQRGGKPVMWKTGHALIKSKMKELGAPLGGEMSGHLFFSERWYGFDDAFYASARLLEILMNDGRPATQVFAELPGGEATPELKIDLPEAEHAAFMEAIRATATFPGAQITTIDGFRVDLPDAWGLIRPSTTMPALVMRFEGDDEAALQRIQSAFRNLIESVRPGLGLPF